MQETKDERGAKDIRPKIIPAPTQRNKQMQGSHIKTYRTGAADIFKRDRGTCNQNKIPSWAKSKLKKRKTPPACFIHLYFPLVYFEKKRKTSPAYFIHLNFPLVYFEKKRKRVLFI